MHRACSEINNIASKKTAFKPIWHPNTPTTKEVYAAKWKGSIFIVH